MRRIAVHEALIDNLVVELCAIEMDDDGRVVSWYPLQREQANTEWLGGVVRIARDADGIRRVYKNEKQIK